MSRCDAHPTPQWAGRRTVLVAVVVLLAACASAEPPAEAPSPSPSPTASPSPSPSVSPTPSPSPSPSPVLGAFDVERAMTAVRALSQDIGIRVAGTDGDRLARGMVVRGFRDAGWDVRLQVFDLPQGGTSANVVATRGGRGPDESHLVVGAHLDTVPDSPGANDNASGVGVLLSLAEELADEADRLEVPLVLVAFGAEEFQPGTDQHHLGSEAYAATHAGNVTGMLSVDMVGNGATTCICWFDAGPGTMAELLRDVAGEEDIGPVAVEQRGDISDHGPFALRGIPAAFLWTYRDGAYHTPADVFERVHPPDVARAGEIALALVRSYDAPPGP